MRSFEEAFFRKDFFPRRERTREELGKELVLLEENLKLPYDGLHVLYYRRRYQEITGREFVA